MLKFDFAEATHIPIPINIKLNDDNVLFIKFIVTIKGNIKDLKSYRIGALDEMLGIHPTFHMDVHHNNPFK